MFYRFVLFILLFTVYVNAQSFYDDAAIKSEFISHLNIPLTEENIKAYKKLFWAAELFLDNRKEVKTAVTTALSRFDSTGNKLRRDALEAAYTLFPSELSDIIRENMRFTLSPKEFAMCAEYLLRNKSISGAEVLSELSVNFKNQIQHPILKRLSSRINDTSKIPSLGELLHADFVKGQPVIFSLQRKNRDYPGRVIIRTGDGRFVGENGKLISFPQLARAISNLPGYLTNGNTPEGIFSFSSFDVSDNRFIGTTPNIQMRLPFEATPGEYFFNTRQADKFTEELYKGLLPEGWQNYPPIMEAYLAGEAGRNEIIAHGTTVLSSYYKDKPYYPQTPTQGCLCMFEQWENTNGPVYSDQQKFIRALNRFGIKSGFVVVVNISGDNNAVSENEVNAFVSLYSLELNETANRIQQK